MKIKLQSFFVLSLPLHLTAITTIFNFNEFIFVYIIIYVIFVFVYVLYVINIRFIFDGGIYLLACLLACFLASFLPSFLTHSLTHSLTYLDNVLLDKLNTFGLTISVLVFFSLSSFDIPFVVLALFFTSFRFVAVFVFSS